MNVDSGQDHATTVFRVVMRPNHFKGGQDTPISVQSNRTGGTRGVRLSLTSESSPIHRRFTMGQPAARVGDMTVTGDPITGPGVATVMIGSMPASVIGDAVSGAVCVGAITVASTTVLIGGRPAARLGDTVVGVNATSGAPLSTTVGPPCCTTVMIG